MDQNAFEAIFQNQNKHKQLCFLIAQSLTSIGMIQSAHTLLQQTNNSFPHHLHTLLQKLELGYFQKSLLYLQKLDLNPTTHKKVKAQIYKQWFLQSIFNQENQTAIKIMKEAKQIVEKNVFKKWATMLLKDDKALTQILEKGNILKCRRKLYLQIQSIMAEDNPQLRNPLMQIIKNSKSYQITQCDSHVPLQSFTLKQSHQCPSAILPKFKTFEDISHKQQVWWLKMSPNSLYILTVDKKGGTKIWQKGDLVLKKKVQKNLNSEGEVISVGWKQDSELFVIADDSNVKILDLKINQRANISYNIDSVNICCWHSNNLLVADSAKTLVFYNYLGNRLYQFNNMRNIRQLQSLTEKTILTAQTHRLNIIDIEKKKEIAFIEQKQQILSYVVGKINTHIVYLNVGKKYPEIHMWDINSKIIINKFSGYKQEKFSLRLALGGFHQQFLSIGSEDGKVYIFHRNKQTAIKILEASHYTINSLAFCPQNPSILYCCGDDKSVQQWVSFFKQGPQRNKNFKPPQKRRQERQIQQITYYNLARLILNQQQRQQLEQEQIESIGEIGEDRQLSQVE